MISKGSQIDYFCQQKFFPLMNLKEYLEKKQITYRECADGLGIHLHSLKNIVYGKRKPGLGLALRIEEFTNGEVSPRDLIDDVNKNLQTKPKRKSLKKQIE